MSNQDDNYIKYTGEGLKEYNEKLQLDAYLPSPGLVQAVDTARRLGRPLLLRGEPGCGKTRLAEAIAVNLHQENYQNFYFPWPIKSTTKAQDGLYTFDHLERLRDVNSREEDPSMEKYVKYGPVGEAIRRMNQEPDQQPPVLLIDEIDKADIDFPNDLLWELDKKEFFIQEVKDTRGNPKRVGVEEKNKAPIVIITSNDEKDLPNAFLRRCLFHYITFPQDEQLWDIVERALQGRPFGKSINTKLIKNLVRRFNATRDRLSQIGVSSAVKKPATSELLDWAQLVAFYLSQPSWTLDDELNLVENGEVRVRPEDVLLKSYNDYRALLGGKQ